MNVRRLLFAAFAVSSLAPLLAGGCAVQADSEGEEGEAEQALTCQDSQTNTINVQCATSGQDCTSPMPTHTVHTTGSLFAQYDVPEGHCSSIRVKFYVDGVLRFTSGFLGWVGAPAQFSSLPLTTGPVNLGPVSPGTHVVGITAEGQVSGCNTGTLSAWGGRFSTRAHATCPVP